MPHSVYIRTAYRYIITYVVIFKVSEETASENAENCPSRQPPMHANIRITVYRQKVVIGLHFANNSVAFNSIFFVVGSKRYIFSAIQSVSAVQGHPKSLILAPIERSYATFY